MADISAVYLPTIWAQESLLVLRDNLVMAGLVHRDFEPVVAQFGEAVKTRLPSKHVAHTWSGQSGTSAEATEDKRIDRPTAANLTVTLDQIAYTSALFEDSDVTMSIKNLRDEFIIPMIDPLSQRVDDSIMDEFTSSASADVLGVAVDVVADGTVGVGDPIDQADIIEAMLQLNVDQAPTTERRLVLSPEHHAQLANLALFHQANTAGTLLTLRTGAIPNAFGFDVHMSQNVPGAIDTTNEPQSIAFHRRALTLVTRLLDMEGPNQNGARAATANIDNIALRVTQQYMIQKNGTAVICEVLYGVQLLDSRLAKIINP